ncbi:hypothetical protein ACSSZE_07190 [Acidithiobacillus caldus]
MPRPHRRRDNPVGLAGLLPVDLVDPLPADPVDLLPVDPAGLPLAGLAGLPLAGLAGLPLVGLADLPLVGPVGLLPVGLVDLPPADPAGLPLVDLADLPLVGLAARRNADEAASSGAVLYYPVLQTQRSALFLYLRPMLPQPIDQENAHGYEERDDECQVQRYHLHASTQGRARGADGAKNFL